MSKEELFFLYLLGCVVTLVFILFKLVFMKTLMWITKENILQHNLRKLRPVDDTSFLGKAFTYVLSITIDVALSWITLPMHIYELVKYLFTLLRKLFESVPEEIKVLRFPLWNNPELTTEAVWAHMIALEVKAGGKQHSSQTLVDLLEDVYEHKDHFDRIGALVCLRDLKVVRKDVIKSAGTYLERQLDPLFEEDWDSD